MIDIWPGLIDNDILKLKQQIENGYFMSIHSFIPFIDTHTTCIQSNPNHLGEAKNM